MFELPDSRLQQRAQQQQVAAQSSLEQTIVNAFGSLIQYLEGKVSKTEVINHLQSISTPDVHEVVKAVQHLDTVLQDKKVDLQPIVDGLKSVEHQLEQIPKKLPDININPSEFKIPTSVSINNLAAMQKQLGEVITAVKSIKLTAEAPKVDVKVPQAKITVPTPQVNIDLVPVKNELVNVLKAIQAIDIQPTDVKGVEKRLEGLGEWHGLELDELKKANKTLVKIADKPVASVGGGGGGGGPVFKDASGTLAYPLIDSSGSAIITPSTVITPEGDIGVGNAHKKFRDGFAQPFVDGVPASGSWTITNTDGHLITQGGNSSGSSYLRISLNPLLEDSEVTLTSIPTFDLPLKTGFGVSISQRILGQEIFAGIVGDDGNGNIDTSTTAIPDTAITGNIVIASNIGTVTLANHPFTGGDRISIYGVADSRMNVGPVVVTVVDQNSFTVPITATNGTYSGSGGFVRYADPLRYAYNGAGYLWENATVTNASTVTRRNGARFRSTNSTQTTTTASQTNTSPFTDAFNSAGNFEQEVRLEEVDYRSFASDGITTGNTSKYTQNVPDDTPSYHIHFRARNLKGMTRPIARITGIAKTGTTTATVTTDVAHGLTTADFVQIYGVLDQTNFPNLTVATAVASVVDSTHFTIIIGTASTNSSLGGAVWRVQGGVLAPGVYTQVVQSITCASNIITVTGNTAWATPLPGEYIYLYGMQNGAGSYDGAYKVLKVSTTSLTVAAPGVADFGSISTGGAAIRMTDVRLHFARVLDYSRLITEVVGGRGGVPDQNNSVPSYITNSTLAITQSTGANTTQWSAAGWGGFLVNDVVSAALTTTTTTAAISPGSVVNVGTYAHSFNIIVTAVTGTTPTLDVGVEESMDNGTNWVRIYDFPRITTTGAYTSPIIPAVFGTRYRYVQTVAGTTPSFTRAVNRVQFSSTPPFWRQFIDRSITLTSLSSTTPTYNVEGCKSIALTLSLGTASVVPTIQLQGSEDNGTTWYNIGATLTGTASAVVSVNNLNIPTRHVRAIVTSAGTTVAAGNGTYVMIKATAI